MVVWFWHDALGRLSLTGFQTCKFLGQGFLQPKFGGKEDRCCRNADDSMADCQMSQRDAPGPGAVRAAALQLGPAAVPGQCVVVLALLVVLVVHA